MPPTGQRAGDIVLVDSTNFTTLFGGTDSLKNFWHNLASMRIVALGRNQLRSNNSQQIARRIPT